MDYRYVNFEIEGGIARMTLNRPDAGNALHIDMCKEMMDVSIRCDEDLAVRVLVVDAAGRMFCAGGDLKTFADEADRLGPVLKEMTIWLHGTFSRFARMRAPVVTAVNGIAAGGGFGLAMCSDYVIAGESAGFTMAFTAAGLSPDSSSTWFLPRIIGLRRAQELMLTNRRIDAREALDWGLVTRVVADDALAAETMNIAGTLANGPTEAYGSVKRLLAATFDNGLETQMELEAREVTDNARGADGREGVAAFLEKRRPAFRGRR